MLLPSATLNSMCAYLLLLLLSYAVEASSQKVKSNCVQFTSTSVCNPWNQNGLFVDLRKLAKTYGKKSKNFTLKDWESSVLNATTSGGSAAQASRLWGSWADCSSNGSSVEAIQYARSYICLNDIFVTSKKCNRAVFKKMAEKIPTLCKTSCKAYSLSLGSVIRNSTVCSSVNDDEMESTKVQAKTRKSAIRKIYASCKKASKRKSSTKCLIGVEADQNSCGFSGNLTRATSFCKKYPDEQCCTSLKSLPSFNSFAPLHEMMFDSPIKTAASLTSGPPVSASGSKAGGSLGIIVGAIVGLLLLGAGGFFAFRWHRNRKLAQIKKDAKGKGVDDAETLVGKESGANYGAAADAGYLGYFGFGAASPTDKPLEKLRCIVKYAYTPNLPDEIELAVGDVVEFESISDDGWGVCLNTASGERGQACTRFMERLD